MRGGAPGGPPCSWRIHSGGRSPRRMALTELCSTGSRRTGRRDVGGSACLRACLLAYVSAARRSGRQGQRAASGPPSTKLDPSRPAAHLCDLHSQLGRPSGLSGFGGLGRLALLSLGRLGCLGRRRRRGLLRVKGRERGAVAVHAARCDGAGRGAGRVGQAAQQAGAGLASANASHPP